LAPRGEGLKAKGWIGITTGFAGLLVLLWPGLREGLHGDRAPQDDRWRLRPGVRSELDRGDDHRSALQDADQPILLRRMADVFCGTFVTVP